MSKPGIANLAGFVVVLSCGLFLLWLWPQSSAPESRRPARAISSPPARDPVLATPAVGANAPTPDSGIRALLAALVRAIARGDARANEAVFTFKDDAALRRFLDRANKAGLSVTGTVGVLRSVRVRFADLDAMHDELSQNASDFSSIAANGLFGIPQQPARQDRTDVEQVPFGNEALAFLGAKGDRSTWGRGTTIAILDTGVAADVTFGLGRVRPLDIGLGLAPGHGDEDGHGTAVAALAAGAAVDAPGVAPGANLLSIRVTDASGISDLFTLAQAIVAAVDAGARIINISLGGYATGAVLDAAIGYAIQNGALLVAAAGNDQAAQLTWPAADRRVVSVGAVDKAEQQVSFSNSGAQLQLTAPGYGVQTAWLDGQRVSVNGTSASAPLVAGAVAALISQNPNLSPQQAVEVLVRTANDTGQPGADPAFGHGIVNLATALNRNNSSYTDTAVASHYYDGAKNEMLFVVQNRSGRTVSGLVLTVNADAATSTVPVPSLAAGETYVVRFPVSETTLKSAGTLSFTTQLSNPPGTLDTVPANNRRASVLSAPGNP